MKKYLGFILCIALIGIDQITKIVARNNLKDKDFPIIKDVLEFSYVRNTGAAWGILPNATLFFAIFTLIVVAGLVYVYIKTPEDNYYNYLRIITLVVIAGAVGNLIDRVFRKYVIDFIYFKLINFPVFNVADIYVTVSGAALLLLFFTKYKDEEFAFLKKD